MGDGTEQNPFTREDVLKAIEENGGTAEGLDLSGAVFEQGIDLHGLDLKGIILNGVDLPSAQLLHADLQYAKFNPHNSKPANLEGADLRGAHLEYAELKGAELCEAIFGLSGELSHMKAHLDNTDLRGAKLFRADFNGVFFYDTKLEGTFIRGADITEAHLGDADWGNYKIGEEIKYKDYYSAEHRYRQLKIWYTQSGYYDIAGEFFFREMEAKRKGVKWWPQPWHRTWSAFHSFVSGYGERPLRVVRWGALVLFVSALLYFFLRGVAPYNLSLQAFLGSLYYSAVSFTALGYGPWFTGASVRSWVQGAGSAEAFIGVFTIALFLVTFTRKMRR